MKNYLSQFHFNKLVLKWNRIIFLIVFFSGLSQMSVSAQSCKYIQQLPSGDVKFSLTTTTARAYVEVFATKNGGQNLATNIVGSQVLNLDGTFTYSYVMPATTYVTGNVIQVRFYSYVAGGPGIFTPGPSEGVWSDPFTYNQTVCQVVPPPTPSGCTDMIQQLSNGDIKFYITFPVQKAYVEVFSTKNGQQNVASNIVTSQINNPDGTFSYFYIAPASLYASGDVIYVRFYSYAPAGSGVFTPGPTSDVWSAPFIYNVSLCNSCTDLYEPNENIVMAKPISVNTSIAAQISSPTDHDWFVITTTAAQPNLQITLTNLLVDYDVTLFNAGGAFLAGSFNGGALNETINYASATPSTYFIHVYGFLGVFNSKCYSLKAKTGGAPFARVANGIAASTDDTAPLTKEISALSLFPNPIKTNGEVNVDLKNQESGSILIRLVDLSGRIVSEQTKTMTQGVCTLSLEGISPGVYILDAGDQLKQKLVIE